MCLSEGGSGDFPFQISLDLEATSPTLWHATNCILNLFEIIWKLDHQYNNKLNCQGLPINIP